MDTTEYSEGQYITAKLVADSPTKLAVVLSEAAPEKTDYGKQLCCNVSIDQKIKIWRMNADSVKNMQTLGTDSKGWVGHTIRFTVVSVGSKQRIIALPIQEQ